MNFRLSAAAMLTIVGLAACGPQSSSADRDFAALQERGAQAMGVDQYNSTHTFDSLEDGGRISWQDNDGDEADVAQIRRHLQEIRQAFQQGDFRTPFFVHQVEVPGTKIMAAKKDLIRYTYADVPRGGEVRMTTSDTEALQAIH